MLQQSRAEKIGGWRRERGRPSLAEVFRLDRDAADRSVVEEAAAFLGPRYLVAVRLHDPGNWATSLAGGSKFDTPAHLALRPT